MHPLKYRELIQRLRNHGVRPVAKRGKGSEVVLLRRVQPGSRKGPIFTVKHHSDNDDISVPVIRAILRGFDIDPSDFF